MHSFDEFTLPEQVSRALAAMKYTTPTPIQQQAIPVALQNRDLIGCAQTGTGKTAAFGVPLVSKMLRLHPRKTALILAPTRELAFQISEVLQNLLRFIPDLKTCLLIGGTPMPRQLKTLKSKPRIIIATPGRLVDHLRRGTVSLSTNEILVLDEADRMLEIGFAPQLNEILRFLPKARQTLFFSATFPPDIQRLASKYLKDPVRVTVGQVSQPADHIDQAVRQVNQSAKNQVLQEELNSREGSVLIFARTKHRTDRVARFLSDLGHDVTRLHGNRSQSQRRQALDGFKQGKIRVLVATDLAARGLDVPHVAHVINYDLPQVPEDYIHRIGRTARAGAHGKALSLVTPEDKQTWADIARLLAKSQTSKTAL